MRPKLLSFLLAVFCSGSVAQMSDSGNAREACQSNLAAPQMIVTNAEVPRYPVLAVQAQLQGTVNFHLIVKNGAVARIEMETKAGVSGLLREAAIENVRTWRFAPGSNGKTDATFVYELKGEGTWVRENPRIEMALPTCVIITSKPQKPIADDIILKKPK
jgi:hypothetical protein